ncbi:MAG: acylphosphatase [Balneolaceae bacterium]|nr:MAG: acylphosphatase [Balneolaceae bacterium]
MRISKHLKIHGRVQGVGFRYFTVQQAKELEIDGWVANRSDGTVETVIQGEHFAVSEMMQRLRSGPIAAKVTEIEEFPITDPPENYHGFKVKR